LWDIYTLWSVKEFVFLRFLLLSFTVSLFVLLGILRDKEGRSGMNISPFF